MKLIFRLLNSERPKIYGKTPLYMLETDPFTTDHGLLRTLKPWAIFL